LVRIVWAIPWRRVWLTADEMLMTQIVSWGRTSRLPLLTEEVRVQRHLDLGNELPDDYNFPPGDNWRVMEYHGPPDEEGKWVFTYFYPDCEDAFEVKGQMFKADPMLLINEAFKRKQKVFERENGRLREVEQKSQR